MNTLKISIIVPVYKVENYLHRCLDSIVNQTFKDWECILVDDGSPDNCPRICNEYAERDHRFRVIHQENAGVSAARNNGLNEAKGEWIGFVDADDWLEPNMYEFLYQNAIEKNADVACCGAKFYKNGKTEDVPFKDKGDVFYKFQHYQVYMHVIWNKLIKRELIGNIRFDTQIKIAEDLLFVFNIFTESGVRISFSTVPLYYYFMENENSSQHLVVGNKWIDSMDQFRAKISEIYKTKKISGRSARKYYNYLGYITTLRYINNINYFNPQKFRTIHGKWNFSICRWNTFLQVMLTYLEMDSAVKKIILIKNKIKCVLKRLHL